MGFRKKSASVLLGVMALGSSNQMLVSYGNDELSNYLKVNNVDQNSLLSKCTIGSYYFANIEKFIADESILDQIIDWFGKE